MHASLDVYGDTKFDAVWNENIWSKNVVRKNVFPLMFSWEKLNAITAEGK
jgi:hypothetical protein